MNSLLWGTPFAFVLQLGAALYLLVHLARRQRQRELGTRRRSRFLLYLGVFLAPVFMLILSTAVGAGYQGERGGSWFFHIQSGAAGLVLVPVYAAGSLSAAIALARGRHYRSGVNFIILISLAAICAWYAYATAFLGMGDDHSFDMAVTAIVPALAGFNYGLYAVEIRRRGMLETTQPLMLYAWFTALGISLLAKIPLARRIYSALPPERPDGYGDCFVVSAAARGHKAFVGSHFDAAAGMMVNRQLVTLWQFERALQLRWPRTHRLLRWLYDSIGPRLATCFRSPLAADVAYLLLKPLEWLAAFLLRGRP